MKSRTLCSVFVMLVAVVSSCEKMDFAEQGEAAGAERANVVLHVSGFEQVPFGGLTRTDVASVCTRLNFAVYDAEGVRVKQVNQKLGDDGFGTVSLTLAEGSYSLVVLAHSSSGNPTMTNLAKVQFSNSVGFSDTFLYYSELAVSEDVMEADLSLRRITSLFRLEITDEFPSSVKQLRFYYTGGSGAVNAATGYGCVNSKQIVFFDISGGQRQFDLYTFLKGETGELTFTVSAYDESGNVIKEREFTSVPMQCNMITKYTGEFFSGTSGDTRSHSYTVDVDDAWEGETSYTY